MMTRMTMITIVYYRMKVEKAGILNGEDRHRIIHQDQHLMFLAAVVVAVVVIEREIDKNQEAIVRHLRHVRLTVNEVKIEI